MATNNSSTEIEVYLGLLHAGLTDWASASETYSKREFTRDWREISNRTHREGIGFITKTLPRFAKAVDIALATGSVLNIEGFKLTPGTKIPKFFGTLLTQIFSDSGRERSDASPVALLYVRQLLYTYYKLELPPNEHDNSRTLQSFVATDQALASLKWDYEALGPIGSTILQEARTLVCRILGDVHPTGRGFNPRHGPGSVATGELGCEKNIFKRYYQRLADVYPYDRWFFFNHTHLCDELHSLQSLDSLEAGTAKVVLVPKDSRGPRLISCEPLEYQWIQQGLLSVLVDTIEKHPFTRGRVNFSNQEVNRSLALAGSKDPDSWVTLDMKDASDRVSLALVKELFPQPWYDALYASRSPATKLPCGRIVELQKFAPMGSAVCFPIEALTFWALSVACIRYTTGLPLRRILPDVYVYGDDIIVRKACHAELLRNLPLFGLLFNPGKCCVAGSFRESCGLDAYKGIVVTPLRIKKRWSHRLTGMSYVSWVASVNGYYDRGMFASGDYLLGLIQEVRKTPYSDTVQGCPTIIDPRQMARHANRRLKLRRRYNPHLQRYEYATWRVRSRVIKNTATPGWAEMLRVASLKTDEFNLISQLAPRSISNSSLVACFARECLLKWSTDITEPVRAYQYALPRQASLRRGWTCFN